MRTLEKTRSLVGGDGGEINDTQHIYLLHRIPNYPCYHLFPTFCTSQEMCSAFCRERGLGYSVTKAFQEDGSTFYLVNAKMLRRRERKAWGVDQMLSGLRNKTKRIIWRESSINREIFDRLIGEGKKEKLEYIIIISHRFLTGYRIFPFLIHHNLQTFYSLLGLFPGLEISPDDLGAMIKEMPDIGRLVIPGLNIPRIIDYPSDSKLCLHCGAIYDVKKANLHEMWVKKHVKKLKERLQEKGYG